MSDMAELGITAAGVSSYFESEYGPRQVLTVPVGTA